MLDTHTWIFDIEGNGLNPDKIYVLSCTQDGESVFSTTDYNEMRDFFQNSKRVIGHSISRWDIPVLERLLGIKIASKITDTLALSWYVEPDRNKHGLEEYGEEFGIPKVKITDWENLPIELATERCEQDVRINFKVWEKLFDKLTKIYETPESLNGILDYLEFKMYCARLQEENGWKLDIEYCVEGVGRLQALQEEATNELVKILPEVIMYAERVPPKVLRKKNGELSEHGRKWYDLLHERGLPEDTPSVIVEKGRKPGNPASHKQVKEWLFSLGWIPETFKYEKEDNGDLREIPQINKENQKGGGICDSIKKLYPKEPGLEYLDGYYLIQHRLGILNGFLVNHKNGYLQAKIAGLSNTLRFKHTEVVNLPKADRKYGEEVRGSLICEDDEILCGSDMSGLEDRLKQHFIYPFDPDYVNEMNADDYDPHLSLALLAKKVTSKQVQDYKDGTDKSIKPIRDIFKAGNYASQYNAYPPRLAITCGISLKEAKKLFDIYWEKNKAIKQVAQTLVVKEVDGGLWQQNPINKFWYSLRTRNDQFSTLVQGSASYCFDTYLYYVLEENKNLIGQFHDEWILRDKKEKREQLEAIAHKAIQKTNEVLNLNRKLDVGVQFGTRYSSIH